jgi:ParB family chromosome partitioning protein
LRTNAQVGEKYGLSKNSVARYIRLTHLVKPLLDRVDFTELALLAGVELSYLSKTEQNLLESVIFEKGLKISLQQAKDLRALSSKQGKLTKDDIADFLTGTKPVKTPKFQSIKLETAIYSRFFNAKTPQKEISSTIEKALEMYFQNQAGE